MRERSYEIDKAILCTASRLILHQVHLKSTRSAPGGRKPDLNVRKPSGSRPLTGHEADGFRTLRSTLCPVEGARVDDFRTSWRVGRLAVHRIEIAISSV